MKTHEQAKQAVIKELPDYINIADSLYYNTGGDVMISLFKTDSLNGIVVLYYHETDQVKMLTDVSDSLQSIADSL